MDTDDLVRTQLRRRIAQVDTPTELHRFRRARRRQAILRRARAVAAVLLISGVAVGGAVTLLDDDDDVVDTVTDPERGLDAWRMLPESPLRARSDPTAVWTGSEVVIVGGTNAPPCPPEAECRYVDRRRSDGAAYDPGTNTWREISAAPVRFAGAFAVWTGDQVIVAVSAGPGGGPAMLGYDPGTDRWTELSRPPAQVLVHPIWTGSLVVFPATGTTDSGEYWSYDPAADAWSQLPPDPIGCSFHRQLVQAGHQLILIAILCDDAPRPGEVPYRVAAYDLEARAWERLPDSDVKAELGQWTAVGGLLVSPSAGLVFDPERNRWRQLDRHLQPVRCTHVAGMPLAVADRWALEGSLLVDPRTERSHLLPPPPFSATGSAAVWTGAEVVVWGGHDPRRLRHLASGAAYTPPAELDEPSSEVPGSTVTNEVRLGGC